MRWYRFLPLVLILAALIAATAIFRGPPRAPASPVSAASPDVRRWLDVPDDAAAADRLDRLFHRLGPARITWLQATIYQELHLAGLSFQGHGRYLLAPDQRFRLELQVSRAGSGTEGALLSVGDGRDVWQASRTGQGNWDKVSRTRLSANEPAGLVSPQEMRGIEPLLRDLRNKLRWVHLERGGGRVTLLGCWRKESLARVPRAESWPEGLPRLCRLVIDEARDWPERIEWWGLEEGGAHLQAVVEFRDPVIDKPLDAATCRREFSFDPGLRERQRGD